MYLSRLILNPGNRLAQRSLVNPYEMHRRVMRAFGHPAGRVLFRVDEPLSLTPVLLVQSSAAPTWSWLAEANWAGFLLPGAGDNPAVKRIEPAFSHGQLLRFRLQANPTFREAQGGKRRALTESAEQAAWLNRKAAQGGFRVVAMEVAHQEMVHAAARQSEAGTAPLKLFVVRFEGILEVVEPELLRAAIEQGIGSAKGFGCGLLSLAPAVVDTWLEGYSPHAWG